MGANMGTRMICGATVHSYVADLTEEERKEIVERVLKICAEAKKRKNDSTWPSGQ